MRTGFNFLGQSEVWNLKLDSHLGMAGLHLSYGIPRPDRQRNTLRCKLVVFCPYWGPLTPQKLESFFLFFRSFEFSRDRQCHGTRKCPHRLSSDKLLRVAVPSQWRTNTCDCRLPKRCKNASKLRRRCSTPQHAQHARPHTYIPTSTTGTPTEQQTTKPSTRQPQHGGGRRRRCAWRLCPR